MRMNTISRWFLLPADAHKTGGTILLREWVAGVLEVVRYYACDPFIRLRCRERGPVILCWCGREEPVEDRRPLTGSAYQSRVTSELQPCQTPLNHKK